MTRRTFFIAGAALIGGLVRTPASATPSDPMAAATRETRRLQDIARGLRNGATAGADATVLANEAIRLRASLEILVESHHAWAAAMGEPRRAAIAPELSRVDSGCARIREALGELDVTLAAPALDRARVQALGRTIGRQAQLCARALARVRD